MCATGWSCSSRVKRLTAWTSTAITISIGPTRNAAPDDKAVLAQCAILQKELEGLVKAPLVEPFAGPAMLTGRAVGGFLP